MVLEHLDLVATTEPDAAVAVGFEPVLRVQLVVPEVLVVAMSLAPALLLVMPFSTLHSSFAPGRVVCQPLRSRPLNSSIGVPAFSFEASTRLKLGARTPMNFSAGPVWPSANSRVPSRRPLTRRARRCVEPGFFWLLLRMMTCSWPSLMLASSILFRSPPYALMKEPVGFPESASLISSQ
jgi:hypothetical protein